MPGRPSPALRLNGGKRVTLKANSTNPRGRRAAKFVASRSCGHARASERDQPRNQRIRPKSSLHRPPRCIAKGETEDYASSSEGIASSAWAGATGMTSAWLRSPTIHLCSLVPWCQSNCFPAGNGGNGRSPLAENHPRAATLIPFFFSPRTSRTSLSFSSASAVAKTAFPDPPIVSRERGQRRARKGCSPGGLSGRSKGGEKRSINRKKAPTALVKARLGSLALVENGWSWQKRGRTRSSTTSDRPLPS